MADATAIETLRSVPYGQLFPKALKDAQSEAFLLRFREAQQRPRLFLATNKGGVNLRLQASGRSRRAFICFYLLG
jgi:hypothetical protein